MQYRYSATLRTVTFGIVFLGVASADSLQALDQSCIRSIEWLVDNSDVIAVISEATDAEADQPRVLRTLKGDATRIKWPLKKSPVDGDEGYSYYGPPSDGPVRLVFVRGTSELLGGVTLGRPRLSAVKIYDAWYGVTQYGDLLLTESDMFHAIDAHLDSGPSRPIDRKEDSPHYERSGIETPKTFPLEDGTDTYVLIVSFTVTRRDHYIEVLKTGDAAERIHAIHELAQLIDQRARDAIREATTCGNVVPAYEFRWSDRSVHELTSEDVRDQAKAVLAADEGKTKSTSKHRTTNR